jgi:hypothetical protein
MARHNDGHSPRPWSKLKSRVEALFAPDLQLAIHCNVFTKVSKEFTFDEPRHWVMLGRGRAGRIIWDFPGPFLRPAPDQPPRSTRGQPLTYWEDGYGWAGKQPSEPSALMREYLDRPRERLMESFDDPWELAAILRAADRRLGRACLLGWGNSLDVEHPARLVLAARFGHGHAADGTSDAAESQSLPTRPRHADGPTEPASGPQAG